MKLKDLIPLIDTSTGCKYAVNHVANLLNIHQDIDEEKNNRIFSHKIEAWYQHNDGDYGIHLFSFDGKPIFIEEWWFYKNDRKRSWLIDDVSIIEDIRRYILTIIEDYEKEFDFESDDPDLLNREMDINGYHVPKSGISSCYDGVFKDIRTGELWKLLDRMDGSGDELALFKNRDSGQEKLIDVNTLMYQYNLK